MRKHWRKYESQYTKNRRLGLCGMCRSYPAVRQTYDKGKLVEEIKYSLCWKHMQYARQMNRNRKLGAVANGKKEKRS